MHSGENALKSALILLGVFYAVAASAVSREDCFPFEQLPPRLAAQAEQMLLNALDREGLYTLASDLKPWSSDILKFDFPADQIEGSELIADLRQILPLFKCGDDLAAELMFFNLAYEGVRYGEVFIQ